MAVALEAKTVANVVLEQHFVAETAANFSIEALFWLRDSPFFSAVCGLCLQITGKYPTPLAN